MYFALKNLNRIILIFCIYSAVLVSAVDAHPMPNTDISIRLDDAVINLEFKIPAPEFILALPKSDGITAENIITDSRQKVESYFRQHLKVFSKNGIECPYKITLLTIEKATDEFVGDYQELILMVEIPVQEEFNPRDFLLGFDAVIHQVPNHFALVKITQDFHNGILNDEKAVSVGVIRYDFANNTVPLLEVSTSDGGIFKGFRAMVALGMHHILIGFDHILFLLTLLIVAPLAVKDNKWTLFQGTGFMLRRFLKISLAFTVGHSAALMFGAYNFLPINEKLVEVLIAVSILITAIHAIRPLFSEKEILVAFGFGLIHGLAFSEVLKSLQLSAFDKAISILGFNVGIELMQLSIMAVAFPFLLVSRYKIYRSLRIFFASVAALIACLWIIERITGITVLKIL